MWKKYALIFRSVQPLCTTQKNREKNCAKFLRSYVRVIARVYLGIFHRCSLCKYIWWDDSHCGVHDARTPSMHGFNSWCCSYSHPSRYCLYSRPEWCRKSIDLRRAIFVARCLLTPQCGTQTRSFICVSFSYDRALTLTLCPRGTFQGNKQT